MANRVFTNYEKKLLENIASTIIPHPYGPFTRSVTDVDIASRMDDQLSFLSFDTRLTYRIFLLVMEWGGLFYKFRFRRFSRMTFEKRTEYLGAWHRTWWAPKRLIARFIEALINSNYYAVPEVSAECGFNPKFKDAEPFPEYPAGSVVGPLEGKTEIEVDVCIIGSGAGGAAAAKELSEQGRSVALLEEGGLHKTDEYGLDVVTMTKRLYRDGGVLSTFGWPNILVPLGCCVGGTTLINSGTCFRCPDHVFKRWDHEYGLSKWSPEKMKSIFERVEAVLGVQTVKSDTLSRNTEVFKRGMAALGRKGELMPRNAAGCKGSGVCCFGCPTGGKKSVEMNYIPMALKNGTKLFVHCRAERLVYDKSKAGGLEATFVHPESKKHMGTFFVKAKVFIVACGTIHTPVFLKNSKMPDMSRSIGRGLTLHPAAKVIARFDEDLKSWDGVPQSYYMDSLAAEGIKLEQIFTPPAFVAPNVMMSGREHSEIMANYNKLAAFGMIVSDTSQGHIYNLPKNRAAIWYKINKYDFPKYLRGIAYISEIFFAAGAKEVYPCIYKLPVIKREEGIEKIYKTKIKPKDLDLQAFHPLGTCRMGVDPRRAALDPNGRLYGMDNVYVADGSIFPTSLGVNPQVTIMAAATKIAAHIHNDQL